MDDWLSVGDSEVEASGQFEKAVRVMGEASMPLAMCSTNSLDAAFKCLELGSQLWAVVPSRFYACFGTARCLQVARSDVSRKVVVMKRVVLSFIARFSHQLGILVPIVITANTRLHYVEMIDQSWDKVACSRV